MVVEQPLSRSPSALQTTNPQETAVKFERRCSAKLRSNNVWLMVWYIKCHPRWPFLVYTFSQIFPPSALFHLPFPPSAPWLKYVILGVFFRRRIVAGRRILQPPRIRRPTYQLCRGRRATPSPARAPPFRFDFKNYWKKGKRIRKSVLKNGLPVFLRSSGIILTGTNGRIEGIRFPQIVYITSS